MSRRAIVQVSLLHVAVALMLLPLESVLNRIMIQELSLSATLVGGLIAIRYVTAPLRVLFGRVSDTRPIQGRRRTWYIAAGMVLMIVGLLLSPLGALSIPSLGAAGVALTLGAFVLMGFGVNLATPLYFTVIADQANDAQRTRVVALMFVALAASVVVASLLIGQALEPYSEERLYGVFAAIAAVALLCTVLGLWGLERKTDEQPAAAAITHAGDTGWRAIITILLKNADVLRFALYLILTFIAIDAQEVILEPYGASLFGMEPGQTARLTSILRTGLLIMLLVGVLIVNRLGHKVGALIGMAVTGAGLVLIMAAGVQGIQGLFLVGVFVMGCGSGLLATTNLSLMMNLTDARHAGLYIGAWTFAQAIGVGGATAAGGLLRDLGLVIFGTNLASYLTAFGTEVLALLLAVPFILGLNILRFHQRNQALSPTQTLAIAAE
jgi:BCD family chlorophyll transporter-like MFS transporter